MERQLMFIIKRRFIKRSLKAQKALKRGLFFVNNKVQKKLFFQIKNNSFIQKRIFNVDISTAFNLYSNL